MLVALEPAYYYNMLQLTARAVQCGVIGFPNQIAALGSESKLK